SGSGSSLFSTSALNTVEGTAAGIHPVAAYPGVEISAPSVATFAAGWIIQPACNATVCAHSSAGTSSSSARNLIVAGPDPALGRRAPVARWAPELAATAA